jgi:hypothetical protein
MRKSRKHLTAQAILRSKRILKKRKMFPNVFVIKTYYKSLLEDSHDRINFTQENVLVKVLFFIETFTKSFSIQSHHGGEFPLVFPISLASHDG